jgi:uncharacterized protein (DUF2252 family)
MVQLKYRAMADNVYRFYRGTCHLFFEDLTAAGLMPPSPVTWICGDLHIENFGSYKADNHLVYFDLNDFDEGVLAPGVWEVCRMVTSIFLAFDDLEIEEEKAKNMAGLFLRNYSATLARGKAWSVDPRTAKGIVGAFLTKVDKRKQKDLLKKRTFVKKHKLALSLNHDKHFEVEKDLKNDLAEHVNNWIANSSDGPYNFKVRDCVFRFAGTGSVGVKRYLFLLKSSNVKNTYLLLDMKEARSPSLLTYLNIQQPHWKTEAERVVAVQDRMQNVPPTLLGTIVFKGDSYTMQELQPSEDKIDFHLIKDEYRDIYRVIDDMAMLTASSQLRSAGRQGSATIDQWQEIVLKYSQEYTLQVKRDYKQFLADYSMGRFE